MDINELRKEIDRIDEQILDLLSNRANYAIQIGRFKTQNEISIHSHEREVQILNNVISKNAGPLTENNIKSIFVQIIDACRNLQLK
ncbi:chorismate mutase [candidate division KSB1 bacterium]|nr:chorismate mutase [candidate division KSB1 bacterium]